MDDAHLDALPPPVREAVRLVLKDLQHPTPVPVERVTYEPDRDGFGVLTVWFAGGSAGNCAIEPAGDRARLVADVGDHIQELFQEEREAWGEARPECPGHPHPPFAEPVCDVACWVCPRDEHVVAEIGRAAQGA